MSKESKFAASLSARKNKDGRITSWVVDSGRIGDKRIKFSFDSEADASACADELRRLHHEHRVKAYAAMTTNFADIAQAFALLEGTGCTLSEAVEFYILHRPDTGRCEPPQRTHLLPGQRKH